MQQAASQSVASKSATEFNPRQGNAAAAAGRNV